MTGHVHPTSDEPDGLTLDPTTLREREDVEYGERTYPHEDTDHCAADAAGRVIVGVSNEDGAVLVLVADDADHAILPNCTVDEDDDWAAVARDTAAEIAGAPVTLEAVECVRRVEHVLEDDDEPHAVTHQVVLAASVDGAGEPGVERDDCTAGWYETVPVALDDGDGAGHGDAVEDLRRFLD